MPHTHDAPPPRRWRQLVARLGQRSVRLGLLAALGLGALFAGSAAYLARMQTLDEYRSIANNLAQYAVQRTQRIRDYTFTTFKALRDNDSAHPCSASNIELMRRLSYGNPLVVDLGYVQDDRLLCSSLGEFHPGIAVGKISAMSGSSAELRTDVRLPMSRDTPYLLSSFHGFTAIMNKIWPEDVQGWMPDADVAIGVYQPVARKVMFARGRVRTDLLDTRPGIARPADAGKFIVATSPTRFGYAGFAIIPIAALQQRWQARAWQMIPVGLAIGVLLASLVSWITWRNASLPAMIRHALRNNEFHMVYQPVVNLATGQWEGLEALIRWRRPDGRMIAPDIFIPVAERSGQIRAITRWMLRRVLRETRGLLQAHPGFHVAVNLANDDLVDAAIAQELKTLLDEARLPPTALIGEITERVFMDMQQTGAQVRELRSLGLGIAIDDFGTGYSSLSYLAQMEMDILKIDRIFVSPIGTGAVTANVVTHIISLAQSLGLKMVAEGVETQEQADWLRGRGVQFAQGWLFARPMPILEVQAQLRARQLAAQGTPEAADTAV